MYESDDLNYEDEVPGDAPEESSNRTFLIAAGVLGGIVLLSIICLAVYALLILPQQRSSEQESAAATMTAGAAINDALTATAVAFELSLTPNVTEAVPTNTPVVAQPTATETPLVTDTPDPSTATVGAAFTQVAEEALTVVPTTTALPNTGFADEVGLPGLIVAAITLVLVIFLARRLRVQPTQ